MSIRILLADDHKIMREGLRALLERKKDMEVVGEADNGRTTVQLTRELSPDVVIMDITMPDLNGVEATRQVTTEFPGVKVIALSMHSDRQFVAGIFKAGASAYLLKDCAFDELAAAIRAVVASHTYVSPSIADMVIKDYASQVPVAPDSRLLLGLTPREREVLQLMAEGKNAKEISLRLHISVKTVETHRQQIMNKLGIHSVAELTKYAVREGLTTL